MQALQAQREKVNALTIAPPWLDVQSERLLNRAKHEDPEAAEWAELTAAAAKGDKEAAVKVWAICPFFLKEIDTSQRTYISLI
jgi:hypothetical protein